MLHILLLTILSLVAATTAAPGFDERIVGGTDAALGEYPYIVSLKKPSSHSCGASILSSKYVLTAAHCVVSSETNPENIRIQYGIVDITSEENIVGVKKVMRHADYSPENAYANDIAILELEQEIELGPNAQPIHLPESDEYPGDNATAILVGWGRNETGSPVMKHLQQVEIFLFTDEFCLSTEPTYNHNVHVCAGIPPGGKGQCNGDSGGPLTVNGKQYGIVSWSVKPCSSKGHPGIFAKVTQYRDWIRERTGI